MQSFLAGYIGLEELGEVAGAVTHTLSRLAAGVGILGQLSVPVPVPVSEDVEVDVDGARATLTETAVAAAAAGDSSHSSDGVHTALFGGSGEDGRRLELLCHVCVLLSALESPHWVTTTTPLAGNGEGDARPAPGAGWLAGDAAPHGEVAEAVLVPGKTLLSDLHMTVTGQGKQKRPRYPPSAHIHIHTHTHTHTHIQIFKATNSHAP